MTNLISRRRFNTGILAASAAVFIPFETQQRRAKLVPQAQYIASPEDWAGCKVVEDYLNRKVEQMGPRRFLMGDDLRWTAGDGSIRLATPRYEMQSAFGIQPTYLTYDWQKGPPSERRFYAEVAKDASDVLLPSFQLGTHFEVKHPFSFFANRNWPNLLTSNQMDEVVKPALDYFAAEEWKLLLIMLDSVSRTAPKGKRTKFQLHSDINEGFRLIEKEDMVVSHMILSPKTYKMLSHEETRQTRGRHSLTDHFWTADLYVVDHPKLENRIYLSGHQDLLGAIAVRQAPSIAPIGPQAAVAFYDNCWCIQPPGVVHLDI